MNTREHNMAWRLLASLQRVVLIVFGCAVTLIVSGACILRAFGINFNGFEEILVMAAFWLYMMGCAYGSYEDSQIKADILQVMMKDGIAKDIINLIAKFLTLVLCAILLKWAVELFIWAIGVSTRTPVYRIPMAIGYASMIVGLALSTFYHIVYMFDTLCRFLKQYFGIKLPGYGGEEGKA